MKIIDGKKVSIEILDEIKSSVDIRVSNNLKVPHLAAVLVGDDGPSQTYVNSKIKACERVGFESSLFKFQKSISEVDLINEIEKINRNNNIDGFIVQLPLPDGINQENILSKVDPSKDVDGFHPVNYGKMALGIETFLPATPAGIIELISRCKIDLKSKKCLVIGAETLSRVVDNVDRDSMIFSDGAGAVIIEKSNYDNGIIAYKSVTYTDNNEVDFINFDCSYNSTEDNKYIKMKTLKRFTNFNFIFFVLTYFY